MHSFAVWLVVVFIVQDALYHMLEWLERRESRKRLEEIREKIKAIAAVADHDREDVLKQIGSLLDVVDAMRLQVMAQELQRHDGEESHGDQRTH